MRISNRDTAMTKEPKGRALCDTLRQLNIANATTLKKQLHINERQYFRGALANEHGW